MPNSQSANQQPISDDQELAKVLAGVSTEAEAVDAADDDPSRQPIETTHIPTPVTDDTAATGSPVAVDPSTLAAVEAENPIDTTPLDTTLPQISSLDPVAPVMPVVDSGLETIKKDAILELRPLVDKLDLEPTEKFDTYLLLLRSTDDKELIGPAHDAAKNIPDEARRAQALLDIIKEIDFLSGQTPTA